MHHSPAPTPYEDVNRVLGDFTSRIQAVLAGQWIGLYLYGSLALGDFDPGSSDIDLLVVTQDLLPETTIAALSEMHAQFARSGSPWAERIEAAYIPREALNHPLPTPAAYPQVEKGTGLFLAPLESGWPFQRLSLREHGVVVAGPDLRGLIDPVDPADQHRAAAEIMGGWLEQSRSDPEWTAWARERSSLAFIVLTLCRLLFSLETGAVTSKPAAARWASENLGAQWSALIEQALVNQHAPGVVGEDELQEMLAFLRYAIERSGQAGQVRAAPD